jgi:hypothetical protein
MINPRHLFGTYKQGFVALLRAAGQIEIVDLAVSRNPKTAAREGERQGVGTPERGCVMSAMGSGASVSV